MEQIVFNQDFIRKYYLLVYRTVTERISDQAIIDIAMKRVFHKVQDAVNKGAAPEDSLLEAWLVFVAQDEVEAMIKTAPVIAAGSKGGADISTEIIAAIVAAPPAPVRTPKAKPAAAYVPAPVRQPDERPPDAVIPPVIKPVSAIKLEEKPPVSKAYRHTVSADEAYNNVSAKPEAATPTRAASPIVRDTLGQDVDRSSDRRAAIIKAIIIVFSCLFVLLNIWLVVGLLCSRGVLPRIDIGYTWFNEAFFYLFKL